MHTSNYLALVHSLGVVLALLLLAVPMDMVGSEHLMWRSIPIAHLSEQISPSR